MKALYLTTALIATLSFGAQAQDVNYDQKNTAALESNVGFVGLEVGEQITQDNGIRVRANQAVQDEVNYATQNAPMQNNAGANANGGVSVEATVAPAQMPLKKSINPMPSEGVTAAPSATSGMDVKNETNLQNQTGFVGLQVGEQITQDNEQVSAEMPVQPQLQTTNDMNPTQVEVVQPTMPIIVEKGNSVIVEETKVIGNTDTGVSVETMMKAKQKAGIGLTQ